MGRGLLKASPPGNQCFCEAAMGNGCGQELLRINRKRVSPWGGTAGIGMVWEDPVLTACRAPVQSLDSCMELDSLRERVQRIHVEMEGREEMRPLPDREEGEGVWDGSIGMGASLSAVPGNGAVPTVCGLSPHRY